MQLKSRRGSSATSRPTDGNWQPPRAEPLACGFDRGQSQSAEPAFHRPSGVRQRSVVAWLLLVLALASQSVAEAQVKRVTLRQMVRSAATIVTGRIAEIRRGHHPDYAHVPVTYVTVEVRETLKGQPNHQTRHVFMQFGGLGVTPIAHVPTYRRGEEMVLFLYPESQYGLTSPVGGGQGKFDLRREPQSGRRLIVNVANHAKLFEGINQEGLSDVERQQVGRADGAIDYQVFASLVKKLVKKLASR